MSISSRIALASLVLVLACAKDDSSNTGATTTSTSSTTMDPSTTAATDDDTTTTPAESSSGPLESTSTSEDSSSGPLDTTTTPAESSSGRSDESSTGDACPPESECIDDSMCPGGTCIGCLCVCDPFVPGEWNSCIGEDGTADNTLCNWIGTGCGTGSIACLTAAMGGGNVCFISGCRDASDCFAPPATGTATVICAEILGDGGTGCALDCADGEICPDGMTCAGDLCFWPPA